jgi:hypothetical protein
VGLTNVPCKRDANICHIFTSEFSGLVWLVRACVILICAGVTNIVILGHRAHRGIVALRVIIVRLSLRGFKAVGVIGGT